MTFAVLQVLCIAGLLLLCAYRGYCVRHYQDSAHTAWRECREQRAIARMRTSDASKLANKVNDMEADLASLILQRDRAMKSSAYLYRRNCENTERCERLVKAVQAIDRAAAAAILAQRQRVIDAQDQVSFAQHQVTKAQHALSELTADMRRILSQTA